MEFTISEIFSATPEQIYTTWLSSKGHSAMTGGDAKITAQVGDSFSTWDDYITGKNIELVKNEKIVQSWRTTEFEESDEDSIVEINLIKNELGTQLTLTHSKLNLSADRYKNGWVEHYFIPMKVYFEKNNFKK